MTIKADFRRFKRHLENSWRIAEEIGLPTPEHIKVYELVLLEMSLCAKTEVGRHIATLAARWVETSNPFYIDKAVFTCYVARVKQPPTLEYLVAQVAGLRLSGSVASGTPEKIANEAAKQETLLFIANLIHSGEKREIACSKGATKHARDYPQLKRLKASTLDKYYVEEWRTPDQNGLTLERQIFAGWDEYKNKSVREEWKRIARETPEAGDNLRGERR